jgi:hypothetical protein
LHPSRAKKGIKNGLRTKWPANNIISCIQQAGAIPPRTGPRHHLTGTTAGPQSSVPLTTLGRGLFSGSTPFGFGDVISFALEVPRLANYHRGTECA